MVSKASIIPLTIWFFASVVLLLIAKAIIEYEERTFFDFQIMISGCIALVAAGGGVCAVFVTQNRSDVRFLGNKEFEKKQVNIKKFEEERIAIAIMGNNIRQLIMIDDMGSFNLINYEKITSIDTEEYLFKVNPIIADRYMFIIGCLYKWGNFYTTLKASRNGQISEEVESKLREIITVTRQESDVFMCFADNIVGNFSISSEDEMRPLSDVVAKRLYNVARNSLKKAETNNSFG